jgi:hypothetical protein
MEKLVTSVNSMGSRRKGKAAALNFSFQHIFSLFFSIIPSTFNPTCRKRKTRWNTTKYGKAPEPQPSTPTRTNRETIMQESPIPMTRR